MGFTTSCFIRKNSPEIRQKLEEMGYKNTDCDVYGDSIRTYNETDLYQTIWGNCGYYKDCIDCGEDEELFFALAGMRDDTGKGQWLVSEGGWWVFSDVGGTYDMSYWRKATAEEIVRYFKNRNDD